MTTALSFRGSYLEESRSSISIPRFPAISLTVEALGLLRDGNESLNRQGEMKFEPLMELDTKRQRPDHRKVDSLGEIEVRIDPSYLAPRNLDGKQEADAQDARIGKHKVNSRG